MTIKRWLRPFIATEQPLDAINAGLHMVYGLFLLAICWQIGLSLRVLLGPVLLFLHVRNLRATRAGEQPPATLFGWLSLEFALLVILSYGADTEWVSTLFLIFTASIMLNYPLVGAFLFSYSGYTLYLLIFDLPRLSWQSYLLGLISFSILPVTLWGFRLLIRQRQNILELNQHLQSQAALTAEMTRLRERNSLAEAMHDTIGHTLTSSIVSLEGVALLLQNRPTEARELLDSVREQLQASLGDIRQMVRALKTDTLAEHMTLHESLQQLVERVRRQTPITLDLHYHLAVELLPIQEYLLYTIVREGVTNTLKHSRATHIQITLAELAQNRVALTVQDNGAGAAQFEPGFGLTHLQQKVSALGGTLSVETQAGFDIHVVLPLALDPSATLPNAAPKEAQG